MKESILLFIYICGIAAGAFVSYSFSPTHSYIRDEPIISKMIWISGAILSGCCTYLSLAGCGRLEGIYYGIVLTIVVLILNYCIPLMLLERKKKK